MTAINRRTFVRTSATALGAALFCPPRTEDDVLMVSLRFAPAVGARSSRAASETIVFAGGCFWGVQAVFQHVQGVLRATSGYAGGAATTADYEQVSNSNTGHAESVQVVFDPSKVTYRQLLEVFFSVAHDPTQLNRQGPDVGPQYRSAVFYATEAQHRATAAYLAERREAKTFRRAIVTQVVPLERFYRAEEYHQDYAAKHPDEPYIVFNDAPKVARLKEKFSALFTETAAKS